MKCCPCVILEVLCLVCQHPVQGNSVRLSASLVVLHMCLPQHILILQMKDNHNATITPVGITKSVFHIQCYELHFITRAVRHRVIKCSPFVFCRRRCQAFEIAQYSPYYATVLYTQNGRRLPGLFVLNNRHQAVESPSHVHRSSVNKKLWWNVFLWSG